jgi:hypothetical protein
MKCPKWFKFELSLGSVIGGFVTLIAIPWVKFVTLAIFSMQTDIAVIKAAVVPPEASAFPINEQYKQAKKEK